MCTNMILDIKNVENKIVQLSLMEIISQQCLMTIPNVDPDSDYSVQVRVIVLIQSEPDVRFGVGRWSGDVCRDSTTTGNYICLMTSVVILCNKQDSILFELCVLNCHYD